MEEERLLTWLHHEASHAEVAYGELPDVGSHPPLGSGVNVAPGPCPTSVRTRAGCRADSSESATRIYQLSKELYDTQALALNDLKQTENLLVKEEAEYCQAKERLVALRVPRAQLDKPLASQQVLE